MAKRKTVEAEEVPESTNSLVKCVVRINEYSAYLGELKDERHNVLKRFLFYDPEVVDNRTEKVRLRDLAAQCDVVAKPGDTIELTEEEAQFLERPGAVKRV